MFGFTRESMSPLGILHSILSVIWEDIIRPKVLFWRKNNGN